MYDDLKGKVALVTGAGRPNGLGQAMAKRLAGEGCRLAIADVARPHPDPEYKRGSWEDLLERQKEIEALGALCLPVKCDVTVEDEVQAMMERVVKEFGRVDILVNNVGGGSPGGAGPLIDVPAQRWDEGMAVNAKGTHLCCRHAARHMIEKGQGGRIVNISSQAGVSPWPLIGTYCAAKAAVCMYTKVLALELAEHKINVNAVLPGTIETDMLKDSFAILAQIQNMTYAELMQQIPPIPLGRLQTQDDVANVVTWLASDQASYLTGVTILATGGQTIH